MDNAQLSLEFKRENWEMNSMDQPFCCLVKCSVPSYLEPRCYCNKTRQRRCIKWTLKCAIHNGAKTLSTEAGLLYVGNGLSDKNNFDGYLSDAYFVDGKIVPPTTFGEYFAWRQVGTVR